MLLVTVFVACASTVLGVGSPGCGSHEIAFFTRSLFASSKCGDEMWRRKDRCTRFGPCAYGEVPCLQVNKPDAESVSRGQESKHWLGLKRQLVIEKTALANMVPSCGVIYVRLSKPLEHA